MLYWEGSYSSFKKGKGKRENPKNERENTKGVK